MPVSHTNRKGVTYTLYRGQTSTGKPRYYFGLPGQSQSEMVKEALVMCYNGLEYSSTREAE